VIGFARAAGTIERAGGPSAVVCSELSLPAYRRVTVSQDLRLGAVLEFYDTHPISERQILDRLARDGIDPAALTEDILQDHDQDHFGGVAANDALAALARLDDGSRVLDVCCGLGGPARYFAHNHGCPVTGIDLTASRVEGARRLTAMTGLAGRVAYVCGNALAMPFADGTFDVVVAQEAFCHIPSKDMLIAECARVLAPGGRLAFTDILTTDTTPEIARERLREEMTHQELASAGGYREALDQAGLAVEAFEDLGEAWRVILADRLAMYRSLEAQTVERFGRGHFEKWDRAYSFFVGLYRTGELSGGRVLARKA